CRRCGLRRNCPRRIASDRRHLTANQIGSQRRQSIVVTFTPAIVHGHVSTLDIADLAETLAKGGDDMGGLPGGGAIKEADDWDSALLRARRKRPRCHTAEQRDELAPPCMSRKEHCEG